MTAEEFGPVVALHRRRLLGYARGIVGYDRGEDVVQTALLRAWEQLLTGSPVRDPVPWLFKIVKHTAINVLKSAPARLDVRLTDQLSARADVVADAELADELGRALTAIAALPASQSSVLLASAAGGLKPRAIAAELGVTSGTVRMLLHRARTTVRST